MSNEDELGDANQRIGKESAGESQWHVLKEAEWSILREARLIALRDSPGSFLSSYEKEYAYEEAQWRAEFARGEWLIIVDDGSRLPTALIGITRFGDIPPAERYLEYLWVSPESRRAGVASRLIQAVLKRLRDNGVAAAWLWILDGNSSARALYKKLGFVSTNERQPLKEDPERFEERMRLGLN
jgi:ribosomal protein S18 acetylase RimI-like enzyme